MALAVWVLLVLVNRLIDRRGEKRVVSRFRRHTTMILLSLGGLLIVIGTLEDTLRGDVLKLLGVLLSAAIAFSSATLVSNAMSGLMLRAQRHFRSGDYIEVGDHYGGVVERGLFSTEIQNELRDRVLLPNSFLTTHPVTVINSQGTLIQAEVSLGYDVPREEVKSSLVTAAEATGLKEPFVEILALGDFSVSYRVVGLYTKKLRDLLTARSELKARVLDALHDAEIEIVSPTFMNQRLLAPGRDFIPAAAARPPEPEPAEAPGKTRFDQAEEEGSVEDWRQRLSRCSEEVDDLEKRLRESSEPEEREQLRLDLSRVESKRHALLERIKRHEEESKAGQ
jgi:small-conductance mechanosensitive channel